MYNIGIIDDNIDQSTTLKRTLQIYLRKQGFEGNILTQTPFPNLEDYFSFISSNEITTLILDEHLNDHTSPEGNLVAYLGNELVDTLRERLKDFPIYMVTSHIGDADLLSKSSQFEDLINRIDLIDPRKATEFVSRLLRSSNRFLLNRTSELAEFSTLTAKVASGEATSEMTEKMKALQTVLELPISGFNDRKVWLDKYEEEIRLLEKIKITIQEKLGLK